MMRVRKPVAAALCALALRGVLQAAESDGPEASAVPAPHRSLRWINPGESGGLAADGSYANDYGQVGVRNATGAVEATGAPFFAPLGTNGRACVSCHQPQDGMSLSLDSIRQQWRVTQGKDPIFAAVDGANCPSLPPRQSASHSLLLERGLFRVFLPWPPRNAQGQPIRPQFTLELVSDPAGCNADPQYGLGAAEPRGSVYRRPRAAANTAYATAPGLHLMSDARAPSLAAQAADAAATHLERREPLTAEQLAGIVGFESQVYVAQRIDRRAGSLVEPDGPALLGPLALERGARQAPQAGPREVLALDGKWNALPRSGDAVRDARNQARESIARGRELFVARRIPPPGKGAAIACASCHDSPLTGMDRQGWSDGGSAGLAAPAQGTVLPVFKLHCDARLPAPYGGQVRYTQDPGRALITGRCRDIDAFVTPSLRGLAARAPYLVTGAARTLREVVDFYDRHYGIGYSESEKEDLANFLAAL